MSIVSILPFILIIGVMFLMTRSAKKKQQQAVQMRDSVQPGTGIRTIGGMYAEVKEVHEDTVLLELAPGFHAHFAKNAIGAVLEGEEYARIVHGQGVAKTDDPIVPDDASALDHSGTDEDGSREGRIDLGKSEPADDAAPEARRDGEPGAK